MNETFKPLYMEMLSQLCIKMSMNLPLKLKVSNCFLISNDFWNKLLSTPDYLVFKNDENEIDFFRNVKPQFTSYQQYFILLYESLMFAPLKSSQAIDFWNNEIEHHQCFYQKYQSFLAYYRSGKTNLDKEYFLRKNHRTKASVFTSMYDINRDYCSSHDHIVRGYIAHRRYVSFASEMIKSLIKLPTNSIVRLHQVSISA